MGKKSQIIHSTPEKGVKFGHATSLQHSSGAVNAKPVGSYQEDEEGIGKKYRTKMKILRRLKRRSIRSSGGDTSTLSDDTDTLSSTLSGSSDDSKNSSRTSRRRARLKPVRKVTPDPPSSDQSSQSTQEISSSEGSSKAETVSLSQKSCKSDKSVISRIKKKTGFFRGLARFLSKPFRRKPKKKNASLKIEEEIVVGKPVADVSSNKDSVRTDLQPSSSKTAAAKPGETNAIPLKKLTTEDVQPKNSGTKIAKRKSMEDAIIKKGNEREPDDSTSSGDTSELSAVEQQIILDHGLEDQTLSSYIDLLGLDSNLSFHDDDEIQADQKKNDADKKLLEAKPLNNTVILENIDFDNLSMYDDEFLHLWDLDAGKEILDLMASQSETYSAELKDLDAENEQLAAELEKVRRKKQESFFKIKDLEAEALAAEDIYKKLLQQMPEEKLTTKGKIANKNYDVLAALLEQREELFRQLQEERKRAAESEEKIHQQDRIIDKEQKEAVKLYEIARDEFSEVNKQLENQKHEIKVIQQELTYLVEEVGIFASEDGEFSKLDVKSAIRKLAQKRRGSPSNQKDFKERLSVLEESLKSLKVEGEEAIRTVDDVHEELLWHLNRREDILCNLIKGYMEEKHIRHIDPSLLKLLQLQKPNMDQLQTEIDAQTVLKTQLDAKLKEYTDKSAELREQIVRRKEQSSAGEVKHPNAMSWYHVDGKIKQANKSLAERGDLQVHTSKHLYNVNSDEKVWDELSVSGSENWSHKAD